MFRLNKSAFDQRRCVTEPSFVKKTTVGKRKKLQKFAEIKTFPNVFESDAEYMKGRWGQDFFKNRHPITMELGCGKGEYTLELARRWPGRNFIGIDLKGDRLWRGAKTALEEGLKNVAFLRVHIRYISDYFAPGEISEIWMPFPDPFPKKRHAKHRLTSPQFLEIYRTLLGPDGRIHLKTDHPQLYEYTLETVEQEGGVIHEAIPDLYASGKNEDIREVKTTYERRHLEAGKTIKYVCFSVHASDGPSIP